MRQGQGCGCVTVFVYGPYRFVRWCFENGWKGYVILGVVCILLLVFALSVRSCVGDLFDGGGGGDPANLPSKTEAPYMVVTSSRIYLAEEAEKNEETGDVTMVNYWELHGDSWEKHGVTFLLEGDTYGNIAIGER